MTSALLDECRMVVPASETPANIDALEDLRTRVRNQLQLSDYMLAYHFNHCEAIFERLVDLTKAWNVARGVGPQGWGSSY